jgi:hypothetical protein
LYLSNSRRNRTQGAEYVEPRGWQWWIEFKIEDS